MKILIQSVIAAVVVYVAAIAGTNALAPRGSSANTSADQTAAHEMSQFLNSLNEIATH